MVNYSKIVEMLNKYYLTSDSLKRRLWEDGNGGVSGGGNGGGSSGEVANELGFVKPIDISSKKMVNNTGSDPVVHDYMVAEGAKIYAVKSGTAHFIEATTPRDGTKVYVSYGRYIRLEFAGGYAIYAHLSDFNGVESHNYGSWQKRASEVKTSYETRASKWVNQGDVIGYSGETGAAWGAHLHFELWLNGSRVSPPNYI
jgi:murein DD-endopeptidase MepM/ murein hydrolase activator NlpD